MVFELTLVGLPTILCFSFSLSETYFSPFGASFRKLITSLHSYFSLGLYKSILKLDIIYIYIVHLKHFNLEIVIVTHYMKKLH